jgi:hypothetical protein
MPAVDPERLATLDDYWVHGRHPSGRLIAAEVWDVLEGRTEVDQRVRRRPLGRVATNTSLSPLEAIVPRSCGGIRPRAA